MGMFSKPTVTVTVSNRTVLRVIALTIASFLFLKLLGELTHVLTLLFVAFFLALALNPAVSWIAHRLKSKSRVMATGVAYVIVLTLLIAFFSLVVPPLVRQTVEFINDIPETLNSFQTQDSAIARLVRRYDFDEQLGEIGRDFRGRIGDLRQPVLSTAGRLGSGLISTITVLVLTFMMLVEGPYWMNRLLQLLPKERRQHHELLIRKMYRVVTGYVNGQVLIAAIAAAFAMIALLIASTVFNVSINAVALAGIVFLFGLIPMIGNTLAAVIVVLVSLFSSVGLALTMAVFFLIYQQVENVTLQPYIQSKTNELTPLLVFIAALLGAGFGGLLGALVAIPTAGCLKILADDYFSRKKAAS